MDDDASVIKVGPIGSLGGQPWDDKGNNEIVQIFISHDEYINSIQFQYVKNGKLALSDRHGWNDGYNFDTVKFDHPSEYITWISGKSSSSNRYLSSITFGTNLGEYGPFGQSDSSDELFWFRLGDHQFGGFYGTSSNIVTSIGVYLNPVTTLDGLSLKDIKP